MTKQRRVAARELLVEDRSLYRVDEKKRMREGDAMRRRDEKRARERVGGDRVGKQQGASERERHDAKPYFVVFPNWKTTSLFLTSPN